jgi:glycosyltransferase involved in cell wall biosynthesis
MRGLVSVIMPSYNAEATIDEAILSVLNQDYSHWELIVINDCSSDETEMRVKTFNDPRITLINNITNKGSAFSRNVGLEVAKGNYICFLDSDDYWVSHKLTRQIEILEQSAKPALVVTSYTKVSSEGRPVKTIQVPAKITYQTLLKTNSIPCLTTMIHADLAKRYRFKNVGHEDYLYWLGVLAGGCEVIAIQEPLAFYRTGRLSLSSNKLTAAGFQWNIYRNELGFGPLKAAYYFLFYMFYGMKKELF